MARGRAINSVYIAIVGQSVESWTMLLQAIIVLFSLRIGFMDNFLLFFRR
jgi:hypothetical protein